MYQPTSEASQTLPYSNGHLSVTPNGLTNGAIESSSESDLSEVVDPPVLIFQSSAPENHESGFYSRRSSMSTHDEDAFGSEDAEYDLESPLPPDIETTHNARSSSQDSRRPAKRKAGIEEHEYIMNNPELYGIRRSVSIRHGRLTPKLRPPQGRARPTTRIVSHPSLVSIIQPLTTI